MEDGEEIDPLNLIVESFRNDNRKTLEFDCGVQSLNEFLCSEEVRIYEEELLGKTFLVFYKGKLVAYYTLSTGSLRKEIAESMKSAEHYGFLSVEEIPSIVIGRLAVDRRYQRLGIGSYIIQKIIIESLSNKSMIHRLVVVQAKKEAFDFYIRCGFNFVKETRREKNRYRTRGTRTMFFDLKYLKENETYRKA